MAQAKLHALLASARQALTQADGQAAMLALRQAHQLVPADGSVLLDLAVATLATGAPREAQSLAEQAAQLADGWRPQLVLADIAQRLGQADAAAAHLQLCLGNPQLPPARRARAYQQWAGLQMNAFGDPQAAAASLRHAAQADPALALQADLAELLAELYAGEAAPTAMAAGFAALGRRLRPAGHAAVPACRTGADTAVGAAGGHRPRIGLVSAQFCASPVGFLALGAVRELARHADLVFFDRGAKHDWARDAFQATAAQWLPCANLDADELHHGLATAQLDAVIDMAGWTDPTALAALAGRPVPRQLKWVGGQAMSTGLSCFDGFITDARQVPPAASALYTELLLRASHGYVSYTAPPYAPELTAAAARPPVPVGRPAPGVLALAANPAKISRAMGQSLQQMRPRKLLLVDRRWQHQGTRLAAQRRLGPLLDMAEFITPAGHPDYLDALRGLDATFIDTAPYAMGLAAVELRLLGKHIQAAPRPATALMCQRHCVSHLGARRFDHHARLAQQLLAWCRG